MNPYLSRILGFLGDRDPLEVWRQTPTKLEAYFRGDSRVALASRLEPENSYGPGKWTAREILCHLADTELAMGFRIRQTLTEDNPTVQPFDQEAWAERYSGLTLPLALETFKALRAWNLALVRGLSNDDLERTYYHPEREEWESLRMLVRFVAGHDLNHLAQLEQIAGKPS
jgi:hypothetical protein